MVMGDGQYIRMKKVQSTKGLNSCTHPKIGTSSYNHKMFGAYPVKELDISAKVNPDLVTPAEED